MCRATSSAPNAREARRAGRRHKGRGAPSLQANGVLAGVGRPYTPRLFCFPVACAASTIRENLNPTRRFFARLSRRGIRQWITVFHGRFAGDAGKQVGRGVSAPRGLRRSTWQGRRFARPLHPTRAGDLSRPPCTPRREPGPVPRPSPNPAPVGCAVRLSRPTPRRGSAAPLPATHPNPARIGCAVMGLAPDTPRRSFRAPAPTASATPRWTSGRSAAPAPRIMTGEPEQARAEARAAPAVIHLPDLRQPTKKVTRGSENRQRRKPFWCGCIRRDGARLRGRRGGGGHERRRLLASGRLGRSAPRPRVRPPPRFG